MTHLQWLLLRLSLKFHLHLGSAGYKYVCQWQLRTWRRIFISLYRSTLVGFSLCTCCHDMNKLQWHWPYFSYELYFSCALITGTNCSLNSFFLPLYWSVWSFPEWKLASAAFSWANLVCAILGWAKFGQCGFSFERFNICPSRFHIHSIKQTAPHRKR